MMGHRRAWQTSVTALFGLALLGPAGSGCGGKSESHSIPKGVTRVHGAPTYGWTVCRPWNALVYSDGRDIFWKDLATGKTVDLTGIPKRPPKPASGSRGKMKAKVSVAQRRQPGAELYPACSPNGRLIAFAAHRKNDNGDPSDDSDSDIWVVEVTPELVSNINDGRHLVTEDGVTYYVGPLVFRQLTNLKKVQESMPSFGADSKTLYFLGRNNELWQTRIP